MGDKYVIAHDMGTSSDKAVLISVEGEIIGSHIEQYDFHAPYPGWVEQIPDDYWKAVVNSTHALLEETGILPEQIIGIIHTTQDMGIIPMSKEGRALYNNITWLDGRAEEQAAQLMKKFGGRKVFKLLSGIELTGKDVISKLWWIKEKKLEIYEKTHKFLDVNGFIKYKCTGEMVGEWTGACSYGFDLKKKAWLPYYKILRFDISKLPRLIKSTDIVGGLTKDAADELGLKVGTPVLGGCADTQSAALGSGAIQEGEGHIYLGTSAWVGITTKKNLRFKHGAACLQSADPTRNLLVGITECAGSNIDWVIERFYKKEKIDSEPEIFHIFEKEMKGIPAGSDYLLFTPWFSGERCPVSTTTTRGTIFNIGFEHTAGHFAQSVCEGIGYNVRWIIENLEKDYGFSPAEFKIVGGGTLNNQWVQGLADITKKKMITTNVSKMAGAVGAAVCAFKGLGVIHDFNEINKIVRPKKVYYPDDKNYKIYDEMYGMYKRLYNSLKRTYIKANLERFSRG